jgi:hypothetical protein
MADYYPALAGTVSRLPNNNVAARLELYEQARLNVVTLLRRRDPQISEPEIMRERAALETAIRRVEAECLSYTPSFMRLTEDEVKVRRAPEDRRADGRGAIMPRGRDLIDMYTAALGDPIQGPTLIGIVFVVGMIAFTGLLYAVIILTVRLAL